MSVKRWRRALDPLLCGALLIAAGGCRHAASTGEVLQPLGPQEERRADELLRLAEVAPKELDGQQRQRLVRIAGDQSCPCAGQSSSLAECADQPGCVRGRFAIRAIIRGVKRKESDADIAGRLAERFAPRESENVVLSHAPCRGPQDAPATLVVFSDFQCPFCGMGRRLVDEVEKHAKDRLRVCFKNYPLSSLHPDAQLAAQAAVAAQLQGKFWEMHDRLFDDPERLGREALVERARDLGLDVNRFLADLDSAGVQARVKSDVDEARRLRIRGTPTFLINGREMTDPKSVPDFLDWIAECIALAKASK